MSVTAYPVAGKRKSFDVCLAFARGCGGQVAGAKIRPGPAFFYGVNESNVEVWREVVRSGRDYFYSDNSYLDPVRQRYFRITKNRLQHSGVGASSGERWRQLGIEIKPWKTTGEHIVICPQSSSFMRNVIGANADWLPKTVEALRILSTRKRVVRPWEADKGIQMASLAADLERAHVLVTWSSAAAVTAVLAGVPVVTLGQCAAEPMSTSLSAIETPLRAEREQWASVLADNQWTLSELADGTAWRALNKQ